MADSNELLAQQISEQIALEEQMFSTIAQQISEMGDDFTDAKEILRKTNSALEEHFATLNSLLETLEKDSKVAQEKNMARSGNGHIPILKREDRNKRLSTILRDDYSALNMITISNTLLHTTALALKSEEVAKVALKHLANLAPCVVRIGELMPNVVARELQLESPNIDLSVAQIALKNTQLAWKNAS